MSTTPKRVSSAMPSDSFELRSRTKLARDSIHSTPVTKTGSILNDHDTKRLSTSYRDDERIGYRHWLLIVAFVAIIYSSVVYLDNRMPDVVDDNQFVQFSEKRARRSLDTFVMHGPRPSGSDACEIHAVNFLQTQLDRLKAEIDRRNINRLDIDIQRPSGCFDLAFLSSFTLCYRNVTNVIARFGPRSSLPTKHAILVNCHFDSLPDSPGATDDAVSCSIMLEILEIFAHLDQPIENDIIFLFNGAEENFLQASHGFITAHPWRHAIRAFVNLEGTGAGGREILFQAGPGNGWLLKTYLDNAPHPHCSVLAQEIFQSGIVPSDTDFRVFRDYGRIPGLDIAYFRNGWVYHTEFDLPRFIPAGAVQRGGENVMAVLRALVRSPYLAHPGDYQDSRWVFYDVLGLFTVCYPLSIGVIINYIAVAFVVCKLSLCIVQWKLYTMRELLWALVHQAAALAVMIIAGLLLVGVVKMLDLVMTWYSCPEIIFALYFLPIFLAGIATHSFIAERYYQKRSTRQLELVHYDSMLAIFATMLASMTFVGWASAFFVLIHVLFPVMRDALHWLLARIRFINERSAAGLLFCQLVCVMPVIVFGSYAVMLTYEFFVPVMGRIGNAFNPELMVMGVSVLATFSFTVYTNNLLYMSRSMRYLVKSGLAVFLLLLAILSTTRLGEPYKWSEDAPRLRRVIILHTHRHVYGFGGQLERTDNGLFVQALDYRGTSDLPDHTFLQGSQRPDCSHTSDEYCQLPYYTAIHQLFPPEESRWVPLPTAPHIERPVQLELIERRRIAPNMLNISFTMTGGADKSSLHITPLNGYSILQWSPTHNAVDVHGQRQTYFVFICYGHYSGPWNFWILLRHSDANAPDPETTPSLEVSVASHYAHGKHQYSETLQQLRMLINSRRTTPHLAVGWWKWAMTHICGVAELVAKVF